MHTIDESLEGRVALVTGARRGIGSAIAQRLAAHGAAVVLCSRTAHDEGLDETLAAIGAAGGRAAIEPVGDIALPAARAGCLARAARHFGTVDILVNNAAMNSFRTPSEMDHAARQQLFEVNLHAPIDLIQQALPAMRDKRYGRIVNISSASAAPMEVPYNGAPAVAHGLVLYGASKAALDRYTIGLAAELHGSGIHANGLLPTAIVVTGGSSPGALAYLKLNPSAGESVEMMAEAAYLLVAAPLTGRVMKSRSVLEMLQQPLRALDGRRVLGDARTVPRP